MEARNYDDLLKQQGTLETYLLDHPESSLFAWYARQNMEAGELDRALKICKLGIQNVKNKGIIHKLMSEIYLAKGETTQSMKHLVECILTREPFPSAIIEVVKNLGNTMDGDQIAFLVHLLNKALPGHPDATRFYKKYPSARNLVVQPGQYSFLEELSASLERSALVEVIDAEEEDLLLSAPQPTVSAGAEPLPGLDPLPEDGFMPGVDPKAVAEVEVIVESKSTPLTGAEPNVDPSLDPLPEDGFIPGVDPKAVAEVEVILESKTTSPAGAELLTDPIPEPEPSLDPLPEDGLVPGVDPKAVAEVEVILESKPAVKPGSRQGPTVKHNITRSMATFTLLQIFKDQSMYDNALEVLLLLREKSTNLERIENEEKEIRELMAKNGLK
ncbi:hypothetical protein HQ531_08415 [bacterium]|nr:hypothetical protein [bacterium]